MGNMVQIDGVYYAMFRIANLPTVEEIVERLATAALNEVRDMKDVSGLIQCWRWEQSQRRDTDSWLHGNRLELFSHRLVGEITSAELDSMTVEF